MSDETNGDSGSRDRATVALVGAKVDEVKAIVAGQAATTNAHFETVKTRLDSFASLLAERVAAEQRMADKIEGVETRAMGRIDTVEQKVTAQAAIIAAMQRAREWRSSSLPTILIGVAALALSYYLGTH